MEKEEKGNWMFSSEARCHKRTGFCRKWIHSLRMYHVTCCYSTTVGTILNATTAAQCVSIDCKHHHLYSLEAKGWCHKAEEPCSIKRQGNRTASVSPDRVLVCLSRRHGKLITRICIICICRANAWKLRLLTQLECKRLQCDTFYTWYFSFPWHLQK